jgi:rubrerythrin
MLSSFVAFLNSMYTSPMIKQLRSKYEHHIEKNIPGGICDMTALFLWQKENQGITFNTARAHLDGYPLFDHNINMEGNYHPKEFIKNQFLGIKEIDFKDGAYFAKSLDMPTLIPLTCLHFQGSAKKFIDLFIEFKKINLASSFFYKILRWSNKKQIAWNRFDFTNSIFSSFKKAIKGPKESLNTIIEAEIKADTFYDHLCFFAKNTRFKSFLEIGSSSGGGSTKAFVSTIRQRTDKNDVSFYCMELSKTRFNALYQTYKDDLFVKAHNVSSIASNEFPSEKEIIRFYKNTYTKLNNTKLSTVLKWYRNDIAYIKNTDSDINGIELIKSKENIEYFDMVLIDGSEFSGERELEYVIGAKIIALDDTETYKCFYAMKKLMLDDNYRLLVHDPEVRNGYAIFIRKDIDF